MLAASLLLAPLLLGLPDEGLRLQIVEVEDMKLGDAKAVVDEIRIALERRGLDLVAVTGLEGCPETIRVCSPPDPPPMAQGHQLLLQIVGGPLRVMVLAERRGAGASTKSSGIFGISRETWPTAADRLAASLYPSRQEEADSTAGVVAWVLLGAGVAAVLGSMGFELVRGDTQDRIDSAIHTGSSYSDLRGTRDAQLTARNITLSLGVVSVASAAVLGLW